MTGTESENGKVKTLGGPGFQYRKHVDRTKWETIKKGIYDPTTKQFLGRTAKSWGQLLLFYAIFYAVLAALFAICMKGLLSTINDKEPTWTVGSNLMSSPGLGFRPMPNDTKDGSLIHYNINNSTSIEEWVNSINLFLKDYEHPQEGGPYVPCQYGQNKLADDKVCKAEIDFGDCNKENLYGYLIGSPCVFLKLNKVIKWMPEFITTAQPEMPDHLALIVNTTASPENQKIWVSCNGEHAHDEESIKSFKYHPQGFPGFYYPYKNHKNYLSPLVAVAINVEKRNIPINIECRAWAANIEYIGGDLHRKGSVRFEIMIDTLPYVDGGKKINQGNGAAAENTLQTTIKPLQ